MLFGYILDNCEKIGSMVENFFTNLAKVLGAMLKTNVVTFAVSKDITHTDHRQLPAAAQAQNN